MPRGGARPGAGRKPKQRPPEVAKDYVDAAGNKTAAAPKNWPFGKAPVETEPEPKAEDLSDLQPLDYLLSVMRDPNEEKGRRLQAATLAAPYVHPKKGEGGKKEQKKEAAEKVASRFTPSAPPRLAAAGGKKVT